MESRKMIGGLLAGGAIGVAIGLLLAPASGEKTRKKLLKASGKLADGTKGAIKESLRSLKENYNGVVEETVKKGKELLNAGGERIKA